MLVRSRETICGEQGPQLDKRFSMRERERESIAAAWKLGRFGMG
jgi:hypothetical protein